MELIVTVNGYDFYRGQDEDGQSIFNILPEGSKVPDAGYYEVDYISHIKNQDPKVWGDFTPKTKPTLSFAYKRGE